MGLNLRSLKKITRFLKTRSSLNKTRMVKEVVTNYYTDKDGNLVVFEYTLDMYMRKWKFNNYDW